MASQSFVSQFKALVPRYQVHTRRFEDLTSHLPRLEAHLLRMGRVPLSLHPAWLSVLQKAQKHEAYCLEVTQEGNTRGFLALAHVRSLLFGRFLVSLPYVNYGGVDAEDDAAAELLIDHAVRLADELKVRYLELRHEQPLAHAALTASRSDKLHMRLALPASSPELWDCLAGKVRNQVRKGQKSGLTVLWGKNELLPEFYAVFSENMRDLGTPVFGRRLFASILDHFPHRAEFCVIRAQGQPAAAALVLHGWGITEVPSASSLRAHNHTCANMLLYWELLKRAVERKQQSFDFGRSSQDSSTHRFKKQWGPKSFPAEWQYYLRSGNVDALRTENPRYQRFIKLWQRLPLGLSRLIGPRIVRGIP